MEFELLLPEDDEPLDAAHRGAGAVVPGLSLWPGRRQHPRCERTARRGRRDRARLHRDHARGADADADDEPNENAYAELVEFVRVGVQLLFEELAVARAPAAPDAPRRCTRARRDGPRRVRAPPPPADAPHGARFDRDPARRPGAPSQQRCRIRLPPGQRLSLPHRLWRARGGRGAGARARAGGVHPVRARARPRARDLGWAARGSRGRQARLRRR